MSDHLPFAYLRVLHLWRWGYSSADIADRLDISREQVADIARKLRRRGHDLPRHVDAYRRCLTEVRKCLTCGETFKSEGAHNRLCGPCRWSSRIPPPEDYPTRQGMWEIKGLTCT